MKQAQPFNLKALSNADSLGHISQIALGNKSSLFLNENQQVYKISNNQVTQVKIGQQLGIKRIVCQQYSGCVTRKNQIYLWGCVVPNLVIEHPILIQDVFQQLSSTMQFSHLGMLDDFCCAYSQAGQIIIWSNLSFHNENSFQVIHNQHKQY